MATIVDSGWICTSKSPWFSHSYCLWTIAEFEDIGMPYPIKHLVVLMLKIGASITMLGFLTGVNGLDPMDQPATSRRTSGAGQ